MPSACVVTPEGSWVTNLVPNPWVPGVQDPEYLPKKIPEGWTELMTTSSFFMGWRSTSCSIESQPLGLKNNVEAGIISVF